MMASVEIEVQGLKELQDRLIRLPDKIGNKVLASCLGSAAQVIQKEAQGRVIIAAKPYALYGKGKGKGKGQGKTIVNPGWLKKQIVKKRVRQTKSSAETIITFKDKGHSFIWKFIEFGTSKMKPHPFMRPAFEAAKQKAVDRFEERLKEQLDKEENR
jgi:HK97 gp10 family phage protein